MEQCHSFRFFQQNFHCFRELKSACSNVLAGKKNTQEIGVDKVDKSLVANFEILNYVPERIYNSTTDTGEYYNINK